jgi:hypothetical protein
MRNRLIELLDENCGYVNEQKAETLADKLLSKGVIATHKVTDKDFTFEYGIVVYKHRFSINRSLDDYEETTLNKCLSMSIQHKYYTVACDKLIAEVQILYKDENNKLQCLCKDLKEYTFKIIHKGDMKIVL